MGSFRLLCKQLVAHSLFEGFIITVILLNTAVLALEDPTAGKQIEPFQTLDSLFLYIYTGEMGMKVRG